jgi:hypothetical protein
MAMVSGIGYTVIQEVISPTLTQEAVVLIKGNAKVKKETEKYINYKVLPESR